MFWMWRLFRRVGGWRGIAAEALLAWRLLRDHRVPVGPKLVFPLAILYFLSPINLLFEWIPFIGQIDDVGVILLTISAFLRLCPQDLVAEHARRLEAEFVAKARAGGMGRYGKVVHPKFDRWTRDDEGRRPRGKAA